MKGHIMIPVWLLDIDGVVNKLGGRSAGDNMGIADTSDGGMYNITWRSSVTNFINKVISEGRADVRLCSTWVSDAKTMTDLLGLPELPLAFDADTDRYAIRSEKLNSANILREAGIPFVWTDDDAIPRGFIGDHKTLLIEPDPYVGLTQSELSAISHFLDQHN
jgi:hypothetical protein